MEFCKECGCDTEVAKEHGDITCMSCGLVLESRCVDDRAECGNATSCEKYFSREDGLWGIHPDSQPASYLSKYYGYEKISELCDRLNLSEHVKASALDFYNKLYKRKLNSDNEIPTLAACLSLSCREHGVPRSIDEICASDNGLRRLDLVNAVKRIDFLLAQKGDIIHAESSSSKPAAFINRFVSALGLDLSMNKTIAAAVARCEDQNTSHRPETIVASVIYLITRRSSNKKPLKDIAMVTGVKKSTIKSAAKRIEDYI